MEQEKIAQKYPIVSSSVDPKKISLLIKGFLLGLIPVITLLSGLAGIDLEPGALNDLIENIVQVVYAASSAFAFVLMAYGGIRKVITKVNKIFHDQ